MKSKAPSSKNNQPRATDKAKTRTEHSAGGVVIRRFGHRTLVGFVKDSYGKWTFPKGRLQKGEDVSAAALRETREEMGLDRLRLLAPLGTASIWFKDRYEQPGTTVNKFITYFLMETAAEEKGRAENKKTGERISAIRWVSVHDALREAGYANIKPIVKKAVKIILTAPENNTHEVPGRFSSVDGRRARRGPKRS